MSGKGARAKAALKRLNQKRARKQATQAQYEAFIKAGQNNKSKRACRKSARKTVNNEKHAVSYCGNLGCIICFNFSNPWNSKPNSCLFSKRFTSPLWRNRIQN